MQFEAYLNGRVLTALVMLAVFVTMTAMALGFPEKASLMPLMVGVPGSVLGAIQVLIELRATGEGKPETDTPETPPTNSESFMFAWTFLFFVGIVAFGFIYAAPLLVLGFLLLGKRETLAVSVVGAAATWVILYGLFETAFQIPLFDGLVTAWLTS